MAGLAICVIAVFLGSLCNSFVICTAKGYGGFFFSVAMPGGFVVLLSVLPNGAAATLVSRAFAYLVFPAVAVVYLMRAYACCVNCEQGGMLGCFLLIFHKILCAIVYGTAALYLHICIKAHRPAEWLDQFWHALRGCLFADALLSVVMYALMAAVEPLYWDAMYQPGIWIITDTDPANADPTNADATFLMQGVLVACALVLTGENRFLFYTAVLGVPPQSITRSEKEWALPRHRILAGMGLFAALLWLLSVSTTSASGPQSSMLRVNTDSMAGSRSGH